MKNLKIIKKIFLLTLNDKKEELKVSKKEITIMNFGLHGVHHA